MLAVCNVNLSRARSKLRKAHRSEAAWRRLRRQTANDDGGVTVEFVIWFPFIMGVLALITDLSFIYTINASMYDSARDGARRMALHLSTADEAEAFVLNHLALGNPADFTVTATDGSDVVVRVSTTIEDASIFGIYAAFLPGELVAQVTMLKEPE